jgi:hypothetical protein
MFTIASCGFAGPSVMMNTWFLFGSRVQAMKYGTYCIEIANGGHPGPSEGLETRLQIMSRSGRVEWHQVHRSRELRASRALLNIETSAQVREAN